MNQHVHQEEEWKLGRKENNSDLETYLAKLFIEVNKKGEREGRPEKQ